MPQPDEIVSFIRSKGPVLPVDIAKFLNTNIIFAGAHLSELTSRGLVKVSSVKVGGSPLYYLPGQEARLQEYSERLHEKELRVYEILRNELLLKDSEQTPLSRVALRQMKDFAKPVEVKIGEEQQLFWRWYLLPMEEVEAKIREKYLPKKPEPVKEIPKPVEAIKQDMPEAAKPKLIEPKKQMMPEPVESPRQLPQKPRPLQTQLKPESVPAEEKPLSSSQYLGQAVKYFEQNRIDVLQEEILKKGVHAWYLLKVPSAIGTIIYYAEAKSKKRINEADLSEALVRGSNKKLPVLFLTNGKLTKSTEAMLENEFKAISLVQLSK